MSQLDMKMDPLSRAANGAGDYTLQATPSVQYNWRVVGPYGGDTEHVVGWHEGVKSISLDGPQAKLLAQLLLDGWSTHVDVWRHQTIKVASLVATKDGASLILDYAVNRSRAVLKPGSITF